jgi:hypothetical protein
LVAAREIPKLNQRLGSKREELLTALALTPYKC